MFAVKSDVGNSRYAKLILARNSRLIMGFSTLPLGTLWNVSAALQVVEVSSVCGRGTNQLSNKRVLKLRQRNEWCSSPSIVFYSKRDDVFS
ncbi:hypothetical protein GN958_ATG10514 [Phytophthora infestans]|uniref:Uncharacterized protein n=1 Tax=Phytophthora infestans TaxID=4787 RepID=A0A8S9UHV7_PHYIN|nr:hypothetical protein GN958_ATG10514 [Phytophthora infestans]